MIKPEERFMSEGQTYFGSKEIPDAPAYCSVWGWDQLRMIKVKGTAKLFPHENIVPLDRVVLEDFESRVIGFTTKYIPGGTLEDTKLPFRFEWLQQLTQLIDFLNLDLGIMHQDVAPRNLLIDPETHKILLFDFDWVACGKKNLLDGSDDVTGVVFAL
jgi:serine/threonine protein kinase